MKDAREVIQALGARQIAEHLGVSLPAVYRLNRSGAKLPASWFHPLDMLAPMDRQAFSWRVSQHMERQW